MRAVIGHRFGGIGDLVYDEISSPALKPGTIRISVRAAGVSFANLLFIAGKHQNRPNLPFVPGTEVGGFVSDISPGTNTSLKIGDRVCAGLPSGGFAEEAVVDAANVFRIPDSLSFESSTLFPTIYATAYAGLKWRANLRPGETLLVHGAAGASGLAAVEVGRALGATVLATAGGDQKVAATKEFGADHAIDTRHGPFREWVLEITGGRGADVVFDPVGGDVFDESVRTVAFGGRLLVVGFTSGRIATVPTNMPLIKGFSVVGVRAGEYGRRFPERGRENLDAVWRMAAAGEITPRVHAEYPLAEWRGAFEAMRDAEMVGKLIVVM